MTIETRPESHESPAQYPRVEVWPVWTDYGLRYRARTIKDGHVLTVRGCLSERDARRQLGRKAAEITGSQSCATCHSTAGEFFRRTDGTIVHADARVCVPEPHTSIRMGTGEKP